MRLIIEWTTHSRHTDYLVSTDGQIKSCVQIKQGRLLRPNTSPTGYRRVMIGRGGYQKHLLVHRLVAETYIPNPYNKPQVNHIDGDKSNNNVTNLEWCTRLENMQHASKMGLLPSNALANPNNRLNIEIARFVRESSLKGRVLAKIYGVSETTISDVRRNKTWVVQ